MLVVHYLLFSFRYVMATSYNFQQFHPNPENQEIINLQSNLASFEKRLDELQKCTSESDVAVKMASLENDINSLQHQVDNVAKSERQDVKALLEKFNYLKASVTERTDILSKKIYSVDDSVQANTHRDRINECFLHLDGHRYQKAADVADEMTTEEVKQLIKDYYSSDNEHRENKKQVLSEFIKHMQDSKRHGLFKPLLDSMSEYRYYFQGIAL